MQTTDLVKLIQEYGQYCNSFYSNDCDDDVQKMADSLQQFGYWLERRSRNAER